MCTRPRSWLAQLVSNLVNTMVWTAGEKNEYINNNIIIIKKYIYLNPKAQSFTPECHEGTY